MTTRIGRRGFVWFALALAALPVPASAQWRIAMRVMQNPLPLGQCAYVEITVYDAQGRQGPLRPDGRQVTGWDFEFAVASAAPDAFRLQNDDATRPVICAQAPTAPAATFIARYPGRHLQPNQVVPGVELRQSVEVAMQVGPGAAVAQGGQTMPQQYAGAASAAPAGDPYASQSPAGAYSGQGQPGQSALPPQAYPAQQAHQPQQVHQPSQPGDAAAPYPYQGYPQQGYPAQAYPNQGNPQPVSGQPVYPQQGYPQQEYPQQGYSQPGAAQPAHQQPAYPQPAYSEHSSQGYQPPPATASVPAPASAPAAAPAAMPAPTATAAGKPAAEGDGRVRTGKQFLKRLLGNAKRTASDVATNTAGYLADAASGVVDTTIKSVTGSPGESTAPGDLAAGLAAGRLVLGGVRFVEGTAHVDQSSAPLLVQLAAALVANGGQFLIEAHVDGTDPSAAQNLSNQRAVAVKAALVANGVPPSQLTAAGYGATRPIPGAATSARIEIARTH